MLGLRGFGCRICGVFQGPLRTQRGWLMLPPDFALLPALNLPGFCTLYEDDDLEDLTLDLPPNLPRLCMKTTTSRT